MAKFKKVYKKKKTIKRAPTPATVGIGNKLLQTGLNWKDLVHDVMWMKSVLNSEKKQYTITNSSVQYVGQVNGNTTGHSTLDITPLPSSGAGYNQRTGASIKVHSARIRIQFIQQTNTVSACKAKVYVIGVDGTPVTVSNLINGAFGANAFLSAQNGGTQIRDYFSLPDPDYKRTYNLIAKREVKFSSDSLATLTSTRDLVINLRMNKHIRFDNDSTTNTVGQLVLFIVMDNGNYSSTTTCTLTGVSPGGTATLTGMTYNHVIDWFYFDN